MKSGDQSGPFWDEFGVEFDNSEFIQLPHLVEVESVYESWIERFVHIDRIETVGIIILLYTPKKHLLIMSSYTLHSWSHAAACTEL